MGYEPHHSLFPLPTVVPEGSKWALETSLPQSRSSPTTSAIEGGHATHGAEQTTNNNDDYDDIYQQPPSNEKDLFSQLARRHYDNIQRRAVK